MHPTKYEGFAMTIERVVLAFAGSMIILSVILAHWLSPWWLVLTLLVGINLLQSSFTGFCPLAMILRKLGLKPGCAFPR